MTGGGLDLIASAPGDGPAAKAQHRRRGRVLEGAILEAAWAELADVGYQHLTMDGVATRAGTSKAVLYRRWRNRAELVLAALRLNRPMLSGGLPDTGSLRGDVLALLRRVEAGVEAVGRDTMFGLLDELAAEPDVLTDLWTRPPGADTMRAILEAAAARGEVRLERITPLVLSVPIVLFRHELLVTRAPVPDEVIVAIADEVFLPLVQQRDVGGG